MPRFSSSFTKRFCRRKGTARVESRCVDPCVQPERIYILEVRNEHTLTLCWSDSRTGHYAEQVWRIGLAREDSFCALSNLPIARGDRIYRPCKIGQRLPANWERMILASIVATSEHVESEDDCMAI
nr:DUF3331 domain-containing protein [Paraburkholderia caribensis]